MGRVQRTSTHSGSVQLQEVIERTDFSPRKLAEVIFKKHDVILSCSQDGKGNSVNGSWRRVCGVRILP